ncbi:unnamed protein product, partial [Vitis vinifera]
MVGGERRKWLICYRLKNQKSVHIFITIPDFVSTKSFSPWSCTWSNAPVSFLFLMSSPRPFPAFAPSADDGSICLPIKPFTL